MIFIAMLLGLRCSKILGLRWEDFDIERRADTDEIFTGGARRLLPGNEDLYVIQSDGTGNLLAGRCGTGSKCPDCRKPG